MSEITLPRTIADYFATSGNRDALGLFAPGATVIDEGHTHVGIEAIAAWLVSVEQRYKPRYVLMEATNEGNRHVVTFEVSGTFPGSPAILQQAFELGESDTIVHLQTL